MYETDMEVSWSVIKINDDEEYNRLCQLEGEAEGKKIELIKDIEKMLDEYVEEDIDISINFSISWKEKA